MHTDNQKKRRKLLFLVLLLSTILLFDALMIFNRQEPQTYQSKAQEVPSVQTSGANFFASYIESFNLSIEEHGAMIGGLAEILKTNADNLELVGKKVGSSFAQGDLVNMTMFLGRLTDTFDETWINVAATSALIDYYSSSPSARFSEEVGVDQRVKGAMIAQATSSPADNNTIAQITNLIATVNAKIKAVENTNFTQSINTITDNISSITSLLQGDNCDEIKKASTLLSQTKTLFDSQREVLSDAHTAYTDLQVSLNGLKNNNTILPENTLKMMQDADFLAKIILFNTTPPYSDFRSTSAISLELNSLAISVGYKLRACTDDAGELDKLITAADKIKVILSGDSAPSKVAQQAITTIENANKTISDINIAMSGASGEISADMVQGWITQAQGALDLVSKQSKNLTDAAETLTQIQTEILSIKDNTNKIKTKLGTTADPNTKLTQLETLLKDIDTLFITNKTAVTNTVEAINESIKSIASFIKRLSDLLKALQNSFSNRDKFCDKDIAKENDPQVDGRLMLSCAGRYAGSSCLYDLTPTPTQEVNISRMSKEDKEKKDEQDKYQCRIIDTEGGIKGWNFGRIGVGPATINLMGVDIKNVCACKKGSLTGNIYRGVKVWSKNNPLQILGVVASGVSYGDRAWQKLTGGGGQGGSGIGQQEPF